MIRSSQNNYIEEFLKKYGLISMYGLISTLLRAYLPLLWSYFYVYLSSEVAGLVLFSLIEWVLVFDLLLYIMGFLCCWVLFNKWVLFY
jgi:hypothetical protein